MREGLVAAGFEELKTAADVDRVLGPRMGSVLVFVNSVCGCAAGSARPGVIEAINAINAISALPGAIPSPKLATVFAGQDREATERARSYFSEIPPSSPSIVLLKDGAPAFRLERRQIEGRSPEFVAAEVRRALGA
jgi:putative YphP/YqiW family bacilliredoxin